MKQNLPIAKVRATLVVLMIAELSLGLACVRLPRNNSAEPPPEVAQVETPLRINLNTATIEELEELPGIGKVIAERIVAHRKQYGRFKRPEHLLMVRGISDQKFRAIRSRIAAD